MWQYFYVTGLYVRVLGGMQSKEINFSLKILPHFPSLPLKQKKLIAEPKMGVRFEVFKALTMKNGIF
jgi:hypothetical protein